MATPIPDLKACGLREIEEWVFSSTAKELPPLDARRWLRRTMALVSDEYFSASWLIGLEEGLWREIRVTVYEDESAEHSLFDRWLDDGGDPKSLYRTMLVLEELSHAAGGWFFWKDEGDEPEFIDRNDWEAHLRRIAASALLEVTALVDSKREGA